jgi:hypothetical protein
MKTLNPFKWPSKPKAMFIASLVAGAAGGVLVGSGQSRHSLADWLLNGANSPDYLIWMLIGATIVGAVVYALLIFFDKTE